MLSFDVPSDGVGDGQASQHQTVMIEEFYRAWHDQQSPAREGLAQMSLRCCDETTGEITHTAVKDIWQTGVKPVFRVTLENGYVLEMTKDHRCLTDQGWKTLEQATGLSLQPSGAVSWRADAARFATNGVEAHRDAEWLKARHAEGLSLAQIAARATGFFAPRRSRTSDRLSHGVAESAHTTVASPLLVRQWSAVARIEYAGEKMTYDLEVAGPWHNFVANGFVVHNSVNEASGRYSLMPMLFYTPENEHLKHQSTSNKQGRAGSAVTTDAYAQYTQKWQHTRHATVEHYQSMTREDVARELARIDLPLSTYTQWYWKIDLHNLLHFLTLRVDSHAQWEIQEFGRVMAGMVQRVSPISYDAWLDYDVCGARFSRSELIVLDNMLKGASLEAASEGSDLSKRELTELADKLRATRNRPDFSLTLSDAVAPEVFAERYAKAVLPVDQVETM
jgi:flavin-dependent thymidylate synthase